MRAHASWRSFTTILSRSMAFSIAVDPQGAAYITGNTLSTDFFTSPTAYSRTYKGHGGEPTLNAGDAFVVKVNPDGRSFGYSTLLGGSLDDRALQIAVAQCKERPELGAGGVGEREREKLQR